MKWLLIYFIVCWILPLLLAALSDTKYATSKYSYSIENILLFISMFTGSLGVLVFDIFEQEITKTFLTRTVCDFVTKLFNKILPNPYKPWYKDDRHYVKFNGEWYRISKLTPLMGPNAMLVILTTCGERFYVDEHEQFISETLYKSKLFKIMEEK